MNKLKNINQSVLALLIVLMVIFASCEEQDFKYSGPSLASFTNGIAKGYYVENTSNSVDTIVVGITTVSGSERIVNYSIDEASTAVAGTHYTIENATVTIPANSAIGYILVKGIYSGFSDPMDFRSLIINIETSTGIEKAQFDNQFALVMSQYSRITPWLGTYSVAAASYGQPGNWDEAWTVSTSADPSDENNMILTGIAGSPNPITAVLDVDAGTITIPIGQDLGQPYVDDWPVNITIQKATADFILLDEPVTGTISEDGSMLLDFWAHYAPSEADFWDVFNTTWTKQ